MAALAADVRHRPPSARSAMTTGIRKGHHPRMAKLAAEHGADIEFRLGHFLGLANGSD